MVGWAPASPQGVQSLGAVCKSEATLRPNQINPAQGLHHPSAPWPHGPQLPSACDNHQVYWVVGSRSGTGDCRGRLGSVSATPWRQCPPLSRHQFPCTSLRLSCSGDLSV